MDAHVTSTDFLPGTTVGLYPPQTRPAAHQDPMVSAEVPADGQVVFELMAPYQRYFIAGYDVDGRWKMVQCHSKPGDPVNVRAKLAEQVTGEEFQEPVVGARGTMHSVAGRKRQAAKKA